MGDWLVKRVSLAQPMIRLNSENFQIFYKGKFPDFWMWNIPNTPHAIFKFKNENPMFS